MINGGDEWTCPPLPWPYPPLINSPIANLKKGSIQRGAWAGVYSFSSPPAPASPTAAPAAATIASMSVTVLTMETALRAQGNGSLGAVVLPKALANTNVRAFGKLQFLMTRLALVNKCLCVLQPRRQMENGITLAKDLVCHSHSWGSEWQRGRFWLGVVRIRTGAKREACLRF